MLEAISAILYLVHLSFQAISIAFAVAFAGFILFAIATLPLLIYALIREKLQEFKERRSANRREATRKRVLSAMEQIKASGRLCTPQLRKTGR